MLRGLLHLHHTDTGQHEVGGGTDAFIQQRKLHRAEYREAAQRLHPAATAALCTPRRPG